VAQREAADEDSPIKAPGVIRSVLGVIAAGTPPKSGRMAVASFSRRPFMVRAGRQPIVLPQLCRHSSVIVPTLTKGACSARVSCPNPSQEKCLFVPALETQAVGRSDWYIQEWSQGLLTFGEKPKTKTVD